MSIMMSRRLGDAFNRQLNRELYSAYLYMSMAAYFESIKLKGFSHWLQAQVTEELMHAMRLFEALSQMDVRILMMPIEAPPTNWISPLKCFEDVLKHERIVTSMINDLVKSSQNENHQAAVSALQWFVNEQKEEEEHAGEILEKCRRAIDTQALKALDDELSERPWPMG
jgi:ferritin